MSYTFIPVTNTNIEIVKQLHISNSQKGMCETVEECYNEAKELSLWRPIVIENKESYIGFAMYGLWINEGVNGRVWLDRFFIDEKYQGLGHAKRVLPLLIEQIYSEYNFDEIYLSVYENNDSAIHLYKSLGFLFNGELDINKEKVMVLKREKLSKNRRYCND